MKNSFLSIVFLCAGTVATLHADPTIGFDDIRGGLSKKIPAGYHQLSWTGWEVINALTFPANPSGFQVAAVSPPLVIYPVNGSNASLAAVTFDLLSVNATSVSRDDLQLEAKGYFRGTLLYDQTNVLSATAATLIQYNFRGVDEVDFFSSGGTLHPGFVNNGTFFAFDDISAVTYLPYATVTNNNSGFETGTFAGWTQGGNTTQGTFVVISDPNYAHGGLFGAKLGPFGTPGFLGQTMAPLDIGRTYTVSFWLKNLAAGVNSFGVSCGGQPMLALTNLPAFGYTNFQFDVTAWSPSEGLQFQFRNDSSFFALDDVTFTPKVLVTNGGFETGDFSGWLHTGDTNDDHVSVADTLAGSFGADFGAVNTLGTISQPIVTQPGQPYLISAWVKNDGGNVPTTQFHASWDGQSLLDQTNLPVAGWTNIHLIGLSHDTQSTLQFSFRNDSGFFLFDEASVYPMPILQNGGFEFGDFTGWTTNGNLADNSFVTTNVSFVSSGYYAGQFGPVGAPGFLSQTFATLPGQGYSIGFNLYTRFPLTNAEFTVSWNGTVLMDMTNSSVVGQVPYEFPVTATGTNATLQFGFRNDPAYFGLDDVCVSPVLAPAVQSITRDSNDLVNVSWSVVPGYRYDLQYATNLMQPNWISVQGPQFPTNFPMLGIDTNPPASQRFYRVGLTPAQ